MWKLTVNVPLRLSYKIENAKEIKDQNSLDPCKLNFLILVHNHRYYFLPTRPRQWGFREFTEPLWIALFDIHFQRNGVHRDRFVPWATWWWDRWSGGLARACLEFFILNHVIEATITRQGQTLRSCHLCNWIHAILYATHHNFFDILANADPICIAYLRLNGVKAREHPVFKELTRVKQYFGKIKAAEAPSSERPVISLDKQAAARFIKAGLVCALCGILMDFC